MKLSSLPPLRQGDTVAVIAPAGLPRGGDLARGLKLLASRYRVDTFRDLSALEPWGMLAGRDRIRRSELLWAARHAEARCIIAIRGGYGTARILDARMLDALAEKPKLVVGFSDLTALLCGMLTRSLPAIHGPMVCQLGGRNRRVLFERLVSLLESSTPPHPIEGLEPLVAGVAEGPLIGGNLTVLTHLIGTELLPALEGAILLLEDVGERPYRIDRCLQHLLRAGALEGLAGLAFGDLVDCKPKKGELGSLEVISDFCHGLGLPAVLGLPLGHGKRNDPVPLGARVELDAGQGVLTFREGIVSEP